MFGSLLSKAERMVDAKLTTIVSRLVVVIPFLVAIGFATAALTILLVATYGGLIACSVLAVLFSGLGLISLAVLNAKGRSEEEVAEPASAAGQASEPLLTTGALLGLLTTIGPANIPSLLRFVARNLPLLAVAALLGLMLFNRNQDAEVTTAHSGTSGADAQPSPV